MGRVIATAVFLAGVTAQQSCARPCVDGFTSDTLPRTDGSVRILHAHDSLAALEGGTLEITEDRSLVLRYDGGVVTYHVLLDDEVPTLGCDTGLW